MLWMRGVIAGLILVAIPDYSSREWKTWDLTGDKGPNGCSWDVRHSLLHIAGQDFPDSLTLIDVPGRRCRVSTIKFRDTYTGQIFVGPANKVDIDHAVSKKEAHISGGWRWTEEEKRAFANDIENLVPTTERTNSIKGSRDPGGMDGRPWLPPNEAVHCWYAEKWITVKSKYGLESDHDESAVLSRIIIGCPSASDRSRAFVIRWLAGTIKGG